MKNITYNTIHTKYFFCCILILVCVVLQHNKCLSIAMTLKYQAEIDKRGLSANCPRKAILIDGELPAYRFVKHPISDESNYEPNVIEAERTGAKFKYSADIKKKEQEECERCGMSLYNTLDNILTKWNNAAPAFKENKGYTHIASCVLGEKDGAIKPPNQMGHFGFYEFENANIHKRFVEERPLT